jgi:hypothetical protein
MTCTQVQHNAHANDFGCDLGQGHTDAHRDPRTRTRWGHPSVPRGMRKPHKSNGARKPTTPRSYWSAKPVVGYTSTQAAQKRAEEKAA